ncbi:hypothetical protein [Pseudoduganella chitinolytica]|uniref:Uncharacterized protein n=1 Tax=Pseudoduganella chitinolytica TaxID=34070 RepID=A0ABY8BIZ2_9BURK|nr:hypothetical protein [Pseudoduganella chitinolytica]WEF34896.1 hypothetical protein PX653_09090 [Pseudoduganella chitinolytica]
MPRHQDDNEQYDEALMDAARVRFDVIVAALKADGVFVDLADKNEDLWELAEEQAEAVLAQGERDAWVAAQDACIDAAYALMYR